VSSSARSPASVALWAAAAVGFAAIGALLSLLPSDYQVSLVILLGLVFAAVWFVPRMTRVEPTVSVALLVAAIAVKGLGTAARFVILQVYSEGDALAYDQAGREFFGLVRSLDFSFIRPPFFGTQFIGYLTAIVYGSTARSLPGGFLIFSTASFVGSWCFYRAHRIAFPEGAHRLYFMLLFFLPTMVFWPSSLGKDAIVIFGTGVATYGAARLVTRGETIGLIPLAVGLAFTFGVRPPVGVLLLGGVSIAYLLHPGWRPSPMGRPLSWLALGPVLAIVLFYAVRIAFTFEATELSVGGFVETYSTTTEQSAQGGSEFESVGLPTSPSQALQGLGTVLVRPFPWEVADPLAAVAGLEALLFAVLVLARLGATARALRRWRGGMIVAALIMTAGLILPLTAVANFGLLVRQRAQLLPFLFMLLTANQKRDTGESPARTQVEPARADAALFTSSAGARWTRPTASPTAPT
jgi:hypothetical protein